MLERPSIGEYWNISGVPVLPKNVIFTFFRMCWWHPEANNTRTQKWSSIVQYSCTSIWDLKYTFSILNFELQTKIEHVLCTFSKLLTLCLKIEYRSDDITKNFFVDFSVLDTMYQWSMMKNIHSPHWVGMNQANLH